MKAAQYREKSTQELEVALRELKSELFNLRFQQAVFTNVILCNTIRILQLGKQFFIHCHSNCPPSIFYHYHGKRMQFPLRLFHG